MYCLGMPSDLVHGLVTFGEKKIPSQRPRHRIQQTHDLLLSIRLGQVISRPTSDVREATVATQVVGPRKLLDHIVEWFARC